MSPTLSHVSLEFARTVHQERLVIAARRRPAVDGGGLEWLVAAAAAGDRSGWEALVTRFTPRLERLARTQGLSRHEAEDAVQDTWERLLRNITRVREPRALGGWLATTARRESQRVRERSRRETPTDEALAADLADVTAFDAEAELGLAERSAAVSRALDGLPAEPARAPACALRRDRAELHRDRGAAGDADRQHRADPRPRAGAAAAQHRPTRTR